MVPEIESLINPITIGFFGLCLTIGGGVIAFGRKQGKTDEKVQRHDKDIDGLWTHQRRQDGDISSIEKAIERIDTNIEWIKDNIGRLGD